MYEYGYTLSVEGETKETVLGVCDAEEMPARRREADYATNHEKTVPGLRGKICANPATYWVRPCKE